MNLVCVWKEGRKERWEGGQGGEGEEGGAKEVGAIEATSPEVQPDMSLTSASVEHQTAAELVARQLFPSLRCFQPPHKFVNQRDRIVLKYCDKNRTCSLQISV